ncbi:unnamed protein product [Chondrus crispus]|uniref:Uncharacterized protein n=1 Tax=Chondrus crispus TaxID=2769 RepID=R7QGY0_CHOCR|nr:unnamed protein product [Chondrus crispus]CDF36978.1 unnamed protein product [Chondrus crispus]|eukprot:XP_005716797.1 unnamed protein product [Chondrus crispus]
MAALPDRSTEQTTSYSATNNLIYSLRVLKQSHLTYLRHLRIRLLEGLGDGRLRNDATIARSNFLSDRSETSPTPRLQHQL